MSAEHATKGGSNLLVKQQKLWVKSGPAGKQKDFLHEKL